MGNGILANPYTLTQALAASIVKPGDTVWLRGGSYTGVPYELSIDGEVGNPIYFKAFPGERPIITGAFLLYKPYVEFWGIEFAKATYDPRDKDNGAVDETSYLAIDGGGNVKLKGCILHDLSLGIISGEPNVEINGCLIYYCGWGNVGTSGAGHALYLGNPDDDAVLTVKNNITHNCFGYNEHLYAEGANIENATVDGDISFEAGIISSVSQANILIGCVGLNWPKNSTIKNCCSYYRDLLSGTGIRLGHGLAGSEACTVTDNYSAGGQYPFYFVGDNWGENTVEHNTWIGAPYNDTYFADNTTIAVFPEVGSKIVVYPLDWITTRAHVAIYNWALANTIEVDLTSVTGLAAADNVSVHNAQDYFTDIQTLTLDANKKIVINMQAVNRTVATPVNWTAPATTFPQFGAFVVEKA